MTSPKVRFGRRYGRLAGEHHIPPGADSAVCRMLRDAFMDGWTGRSVAFYGPLGRPTRADEHRAHRAWEGK